MKEIYPEVQTNVCEDFVSFRTRLVKKHYGKYYYVNFLRKYYYDGENELANCVNMFHSEVYKYIILGKVIPRLKTSYGEDIFDLTEHQISEKERLSLEMEKMNT